MGWQQSAFLSMKSGKATGALAQNLGGVWRGAMATRGEATSLFLSFAKLLPLIALYSFSFYFFQIPIKMPSSPSSPLFAVFHCFVSSSISSSLFFIAIFLLQFVLPGASADIDLSTKSGSKVCVGEICGESSVVHYYECCGQFYNDCCLRLQTWLIVVLLVAVICVIASFLIGLIKCICCCNDR